MAGLPTSVVVAIAATALIAAGASGAWLVYRKGETAGAAAIGTAVQTRTVKALDAARSSKEKADDQVRRTPYGDRVDGLR